MSTREKELNDLVEIWRRNGDNKSLRGCDKLPGAIATISLD
jgi:hypothetical protein